MTGQLERARIPHMTTTQKQLGAAGPQVFSLSLGCMGMSGMYGPSEESESIATIHQALDEGINLIDTGDFYGTGHNEMLIGRALKGKRDKAILSVKFGALRGPKGAWTGFDARPVAIKNFIMYSLTRLGVDYIDIYRPSRLDPQVPIEESIGAIAELVKGGYVKHIGLSEVGAETIRRAHKVHPIADLQIEYAIVSRSPEAKIFPVLRELGIGVTAYGVLSRGLLAGSKPTSPADFRAHMPRFVAENFEKNSSLVDTLRDIAKEKGATATQLCIAWVLAKSEATLPIVPVVGSRTRAQLTEALGAAKLVLSADDLARIEKAVPPEAIAGTRYHEQQMRHLDSEK